MNVSTEKKRLVYIDYLKVLALLCMFVAHVGAPNYIIQIRNFDVVLMVMCSGVLASHNQKGNEKSGDFLKKRILRLVIPTYMFLIFYFGLSYCIGQRQSVKVIVDTFLFQQSGIGYTWIILVYLICAIMTPIVRRIYPNLINFGVFIGLLIIQELFCYFKVWDVNEYIQSVVCYIIPYVLTFWVGYWIDSFEEKKIKIIISVSIVMFMLMAIYLSYKNSQIVLTSVWKYPPRFYYLVYGFGIGGLIFYIFRKKIGEYEPKMVRFVASSTLWIYLWHIVVVKLLEHAFLDISWMLKFILVTSVATSITLVQNRVVAYLENKNPKIKMMTKYLRG